MFQVVGNLAKSSSGSDVEMPSFVTERMHALSIPSYRQLAVMADVDLVTMLYGLRGKREISLKSARKVAKALQVKLDEFVEKTGLGCD